MAKTKLTHLAAAAVVALALASLTWRRSPAVREDILPALLAPILGIGVGAAMKATGADKKLENAIGGAIGGKKKYEPTYVGRRWDGADWSCPHGTIETGMDNSKACINGGFHPPIWRWDGKQWSHSCMYGTVPTKESEWEKKCEAGWNPKIMIDGKWKCPEGTEDTGKNFDTTTDWHEAHKQCKRGRPYTLRINAGGKWACPDFSKDTGRSWGNPKANEWDQCKWQP